MKLYLIAGEASGDLHGSALMRALKAQEPSVEFRYWGGDEMASVAGPPQKHIRDLDFMGFSEVVRHLPTILGNFKEVKQDILRFQPDALVLIDYPGFNLRMAKWAKEKGIRVIYYISPQLWAWNQSRVKKIEKYVDQMLVILPFEKAFYASHGIDVDYVGHPLAERFQHIQKEEGFIRKNGLDDRPIISFLPGSRKQEIESMLPIMMKVTNDPTYQYVVAGAPSQEASFYDEILEGHPNIRLISGQTYQLLLHSRAALVTSGTATLETALLNTPQIVCYKGSAISYQIAKRVIKVRYISLVNLILDRPLVPELIQSELNEQRLREELKDILDGPKRQEMLDGYAKIHSLLGDKKASEVAADLIIEGIESYA